METYEPLLCVIVAHLSASLTKVIFLYFVTISFLKISVLFTTKYPNEKREKGEEQLKQAEEEKKGKFHGHEKSEKEARTPF